MAMCVVLMGTFVVILDSTIINVALPEIGRDLRAPGAVQWVVTAYLLAVAITQLGAGWASDRFGKKTTYATSMGLFAVGALLAAMAPTIEALIAFRALQGLGGGAMMPVGLAMLYELFPADRRGTALGVWGIAAMAAPAIGPVAGGWIATSVSWRWIFVINVPISLLGLGLALLILRDVGFRERRRLDWVTLLLAAAGLSSVLVALDMAAAAGSRTLAWTLAGSGVAGLVTAGVRELRSTSPLIELRMFTVPTFGLTIALVWLLTIAQFARLVVMPIELQVVRGLTPLAAGLILAPAALGTAVAMPLGGFLSDRIGPRVPVTTGLTIMTGAVWALAHVAIDTPTSHITVMLTAQGVGFGMAMMPSTVAAMNALPPRLLSRAAAVRSLNRQVAGSVGVALLAGFVASRIGTLAGSSGTTARMAQETYNDAFLLAFFGVAVAVVLALFLPGGKATRRLQHQRAAEAHGPELG